MNHQIEKAIEVLNKGGIILYPTDTIWGLGCDATNPKAVEKVYKIKQRADNKSLVVLANGPDMVTKYVKEVPEIAYSLIDVADKPLTIIYPEGLGLAPNLAAEDKSIGIRIPANEFCIRLITRFRKPIVSTSANISGSDAPEYFEDVSEEIKNAVDFIVDPDLDLDLDSTHNPSSIIKVGLKGEVKIIRE